MKSGPTTVHSLLAELDRWSGTHCRTCRRTLCGHAVLCSVALGLKASPRCPDCLARGLQRPTTELMAQLVDYMQRRECYRAAWAVACERERFPRCDCPPFIPEGGQMSNAYVNSADHGSLTSSVDAEWDAGPLGCGDLVLQLRQRLSVMKPGQILRLTAQDPGAPADLPSWCRLTGHRLIHAEPPIFLIQRKEDV